VEEWGRGGAFTPGLEVTIQSRMLFITFSILMVTRVVFSVILSGSEESHGIVHVRFLARLGMTRSVPTGSCESKMLQVIRG
jgi:hypothetical protein